MPPQTSDLELIDTADLACELLRRSDVGVLTIGTRPNPEANYVIKTFAKGSFIHRMMILRNTKEIFADIHAGE